MYNSKLILLYKSLSFREKSLFRKWIKSPLHNKHEDILKLFDFISSKKLITKRTVEKKALFKFIYPAKQYSDLRLRHMMALGVSSLENFVCFIRHKEDSFQQEKNLIKHYSDRNLEKFALQYINKSKATQAKRVIRDSQYYYEQYQLERIILEHNEKQQRVQTSNLQEMTDAYSIAFIIETLQSACAALAYQNLNKKNRCEFPFLDTILDFIQQGRYDSIIAIQFYYYSYLSLANPDEVRYFLQLKQLLFDQHNALPLHEIKHIHIIAFNFCIKKLNTGAEEYVQEVFELFKYGLEYQILIEDDVLSRFTYKNIITAALRLKKIAWTTTFIQEYTALLEPQYQTNYQHFAEAKLLFTKGNYKQTLQLLNQVEYDDLFLNLDAKITLIKIYYETNSITALDSFLNSFYVYLQRKEIMGYHQNNYKNIVKYTRKLAYIASHDKIGIQKLQQQIEQENPLTERAWLLEQIKKL